MKTTRSMLSVAAGCLMACATTRPEVAPTAPAVDARAAKAAAEADARRALLATPGAPDAEFRQAQPEPGTGPVTFAAPVPKRLTLKNGASVLLVENHALPLVSIDIAIPVGADVEALDKTGLADFTAAMLEEGTAKHPGLQLAEAIDDLALRLTSTASAETLHLKLDSLSETLPQALDLLAEVLLQPEFEAAAVERVRNVLLTGLLQKKASPWATAFDQASRLFYGPKHPLGQPNGGTPETLAHITVADLKKFHDTWYRPNGAVIGVSGDVTPAALQPLLEARLAAWRPKAAAKPKLPAPPELARRVVLVDKPGASQSQVWVLGRLCAAKDADAVPISVANNIVGGLFSSRLNLNLRETKSWSYGVRSHPDLRRTDGLLLTIGGIQAPYTAEALAEYYQELETFSSGALREGELAGAKEAIIRGLPSQLETNSAVAASMANLALAGLPLDHYATLPARVAKVDAKEVAPVATKYFTVAKMPAVVVGPSQLSQQKLTALKVGEVTLVAP